MRGSRTLSFISKRMALATALSSVALFGSSVVVAVPVTVVVTSVADAVTSCATTGTADVRTAGCTLRDAIIFSNATPPAPPGQNLIHFDIPGSGVQTITLADTLPPVTTATAIDGYSQPGATPNTLALGDDAVLLILVDGSELAGGDAAFTIAGGTGSVLRGLVVNGAPPTGIANLRGVDAIHVFSCCNSVAGSFIGVDPAGAQGRVGGVLLDSSRNRIGGPAAADRNVISNSNPNASPPAILVLGDNNAIEGNYVGTDATGTTGLATVVTGIELDGSSNVIGGLVGRGNVISNFDWGVFIGGPNTPIGAVRGTGNLVSGNFIGTDATGDSAIPNVEDGVLIAGSGNIIGTPAGSNLLGFFPGNRIAFNGMSGVVVWGGQPPLPGSIPEADRNMIRSNSIFSNAGIGIDLGAPNYVITGDGVTFNDNCDGDSGGNKLQNYPVLTQANALQSKTEIEGTLNSQPNTTYDIQLFSNRACDPSGFGQGETFLGDVFVTTGASCNASFTASVSVADAPVGEFITATATDPLGNTSEFSACQPITAPRVPTSTRFLVEGPIRVAPGVPVEFPFRVAQRSRPIGATGSITGEVVVSDDVGDLCRAQVQANGAGSCSLVFGQAGHDLVRAHYLGDANFEPSTSPPKPALVGGAATR